MIINRWEDDASGQLFFNKDVIKARRPEEGTSLIVIILLDEIIIIIMWNDDDGCKCANADKLFYNIYLLLLSICMTIDIQSNRE